MLYSVAQPPLKIWTKQPDREDVGLSWISFLQRKSLGIPVVLEEFSQLLNTSRKTSREEGGEKILFPCSLINTSQTKLPH